MSSIKEKDIWQILQSYFRKNSIVCNQTESYDNFINFGMQEIITQESTISIPNYTVKFNQISLAPPQVIEEDRSLRLLYPMDARRRDLTYDSAILCDITETYWTTDENKETKFHPRIIIGRIPVMLRSSICNLSKLNSDEIVEKGECSSDPGGYFIIKGNERTLVGQMRNVYNQVFVLRQKSGEKYKWIAETRSMSDETGHSVLIQAMIGNDDRTVDFSLPYIKEPIPVGVVFKAFGYSEEDIVNLIGLDNSKTHKYIRFILRDSFFCKTKEEALKHISKFAMHIITEKKEQEYAWQVIESETLPHTGISGTLAEQACFLARMVKRLLMTHIGERSEDDRDNYSNKRVETAGTLLYDIFRNLFKKYIDFIKSQLEKRKQRPDILSIISRIKSITEGIRRCFSTGNWGIQKNAYIRTGVSQILDRMTYCATLSHLRRVIIPTGKEGKNVAMRQIHSSSFGFICPCECFDPETPILLWNGTIKLAKNIAVGDILIDDKGCPIRVKSTCAGIKEMYTISHTEKEFDSYTVTDNHILTLLASLHKKISFENDKYTVTILDKKTILYTTSIFNTKEEAITYCESITDDNIIDISIEKYLSLPEQIQKSLKTFKTKEINWPELHTDMIPYLIGELVGGGRQYINQSYIINSTNNRLKLLAGLIDSTYNGLTQSKFNFVENKILVWSGTNLDLANKLAFVIQSLGFHLYRNLYEDIIELRIEYTKNYGNDTYTTLKELIKTQQPVQSDFMLISRPSQPFVGWQVEGNGRFLLGDFTVTHNTPEGQKIGVVLNYALMCKITKKIPKVNVRSVLDDCKTIIPVKDMNLQNIKDYTAIFLNGSVIGFTEDSSSTVDEICLKRHQGLLEKEVSVSYDIVDNDIRIFCDEGRFSRPLFTLENNILNIQPQEKYKWSSLVRKGLIQYVDAAEIENSVIAMTQEYLKLQHNDFCEIHPCTMLGIMAAMIPFSDHSQSPRNCYQSSMGKQALGIPTMSYNLRTDTLLHVLHYPQRPLVCTKAAELIGINNMPSGINAIVAIACYSGFNQEDSLMINLSAIQRGLFCLTSYHTIDCCEKKRDTYSFEEICLPPVDSNDKINLGEDGYFRRKNANYSLLDENGIVRPREKGSTGPCTVVKKGDVIVGKVIITGNKSGKETKIDASVVIQPGEEGVIDRVHVTVTPNGYKLVKIVIRVTREPTLGDKLACYDPETEVLTTDGWISVTNITKSHKVACLLDKKRLEYINPTEIQEYDYEGKMYKVESDKIDVKVTPNHRMFIGNCHRQNFKIKRADEIYGKMSSYKNNIDEWNGSSLPFILKGVEGLQDLQLPLKEWCIFFGIWIAEGSCTIMRLETGGIRSRGVKIAANKPRVREALEKCMEKLGLKCALHMSKGELVLWHCGDPRLINYLKPLSVGAINKSLPEWCFELDMTHSRYLIEGMVLGDGCYMGGTSTTRYYTASLKLRDDFQRLCLHAGWGCNYYLKSPKGTTSICLGKEIKTNADYWSLTICKTQTTPLVNKYLKKGKRQDSWEEYKGKVYCCTVPTEDGVIFVRRGGKSFWCANSRSAQKGTVGMVYRQEDMPFSASGVCPEIIINPLCLSANSLVSLSDGNTERIDRIVSDESRFSVLTVDSTNFSESNTSIHSSFAIKPEKRMVKVSTWSGREIICTEDHPFLVDKDEWRNACDLRPNKDMLTIVHCPKRVSEKGEIPVIKWEFYTKKLENFTLSEEKLQILARLLGSVETDGHITIRNRETMTFRILLYVGEEKDVQDICSDVEKLGFPRPTSRLTVTKKDGLDYMKTYKVELTPSLGYVLYKLGAHIGRKSECVKQFPEWLKTASPEVKRQFLCGIQGGDGSYISVNQKTAQQQIRLKPTKMTARNVVFESHMEYMKCIQSLFKEFEIESSIRVETPKDVMSKEICICISVKMKNVEKYSDLIFYAYCNHKQVRSRIGIEFLRLRNRKVRIPFEKMKEFMRGDTVGMYVESVEYVDKEDLVYDFSTKSENHSFVANSIVVHNCIPSRMTINQLVECALGKNCTISGEYGDATPFTANSQDVADKLIKNIEENLQEYGFQSQGWETLYNGMTGEMINARIFMGPTYYQRLKHMVDDKMHARAQGHVTMLTRQPLEGRSRDGQLDGHKAYLIILWINKDMLV